MYRCAQAKSSHLPIKSPLPFLPQIRWMSRSQVKPPPSLPPPVFGWRSKYITKSSHPIFLSRKILQGVLSLNKMVFTIFNIFLGDVILIVYSRREFGTDFYVQAVHFIVPKMVIPQMVLSITYFILIGTFNTTFVRTGEFLQKWYINGTSLPREKSTPKSTSLN